MTDIYLRAADAAELSTVLIAACIAEARGGDLIARPGFVLDIIGQISRLTGYDAQGDPVMDPLAGWHANLRGELSAEQADALAAIVIPMPANPFRVWA